MTQSVGSASAQHTSYGFENLARFSVQASKTKSSASGGDSTRTSSAQNGELSAEELRQVQQLKATDRKVRAHEQAHISVGADLITGGPSYSYQTGPDNKRYAVAGEVSIDSSPGRTPEETIPKAQHIRATALAPADPSAQDSNVAAKASRMEGQARVELLAEKQDQSSRSADQSSARSYSMMQLGNLASTRIGSGLDLYA